MKFKSATFEKCFGPLSIAHRQLLLIEFVEISSRINFRLLKQPKEGFLENDLT